MEVNQEGTSLDLSSAAGLINERINGAEEAPIEESNEEAPVEEAEKAEEAEVKASESDTGEEAEEGEAEEEETLEAADTEESEEELPQWESVSELMEAAELTQEQFDNLKIARKINGVEEEVTLAELVAGNQRDEDYRRKTMEHSEKRKEFEAEQSAFYEQAQQKIEYADMMIQQLNSELTGDYQNTNWKELAEIDPGGYALKKVQFQEKQQALQAAYQENLQQKQAYSQEMQQKQQQQHAQYLEQQEKLLVSKIPEWSKPEVKSKKQAEIIEYMRAEGFTDEEIQSTADHRHVWLLNKAMAYDALTKKSAPQLKKLKSVPKMLKPGAKVSKTTKQSTRKAKLSQQAKKTGSINDAAALIGSLLK